MRTFHIVALVLAVGSISGSARSEPPAPDAGARAAADGATEQWRRLEADTGSVRYRSGFRADARDVAMYLDAARARLAWPFPNLLDGEPEPIRVVVELVPRPTRTVPPGLAHTRSRGDGDRIRARIRMLAPSAHPASARTKAGLPMDAAYVVKTIFHEYAGLVLDRLYRVHNSRRDVYDEPTWFVQGWQEYLAIRYGPQRARSKVLPVYLEATSREELFEEGRVAPDDPYVGGALLLAFLHHNYGAEPVHCVARNESATFRDAFEECFGISSDSLVDRYDPNRVGIAPMCRAAPPSREQ